MTDIQTPLAGTFSAFLFVGLEGLWKISSLIKIELDDQQVSQSWTTLKKVLLEILTFEI